MINEWRVYILEIILKILLCGDGGVGKSSLREQFMGRGFKSNYMATIGADFAVKSWIYSYKGISYNFKYMIWDLAGQPGFSAIRKLYYQGGHGVLLVYDVTKYASYVNIEQWMTEIIKNMSGKPSVLILLANKSDLRRNFPEAVTTDRGQTMAQDLSEKHGYSLIPVGFFETSAKTGENVQVAFEEFAKAFIKSDESM